MSSDKTQKSNRFEIMIAVLFMSLFAAFFLIVAVPKDNITSFVCNYARGYDIFDRMCSNLPSPIAPAGSGQLVDSKVNSACLDAQGLKISVAFDEPLTGVANIQVFSTGEDFFPSEQGISDSFRMNVTIPTAVDHLNLVIPVDSMPVGEQIFGNIVVSEEHVSSQVAYSLNVPDCSSTGALPFDQTLAPSLYGIPVIRSATCLPSTHLMIAFEFENPVLGQFQALVADIPYQLASVINQPATLYFFGDPPPEGPIVIRLISATNQEIVFKETYTPPVCGAI